MSDLNVGVGPVWDGGAKLPPLPGSCLLATNLKGFGGGKKVGGNGGAKELEELSVGGIGLVHSLLLL